MKLDNAYRNKLVKTSASQNSLHLAERQISKSSGGRFAYSNSKTRIDVA